MEREIVNTFLAFNGEIFIQDNHDVLYCWNNGYCYPFMKIMDNIRKCFKCKNKYYVYHGSQVTAFDINYVKNDDHNLYNLNNIDDIYYHCYTNNIFTLSDGIVYRINSRGSMKLSSSKSIVESIKLVDNVLLMYCDNAVNFHNITNNNLYILSIKIDFDTYINIYGYDSNSRCLLLINGFEIFIGGDELVPMFSMENIKNNKIFKRNKCFMTLSEEILYCYYDKSNKESIVDPLIQLLEASEYECMYDIGNNYDEEQNFEDDIETIETIEMVAIILSPKMTLSVITNDYAQIIVCNKIPYTIENIFMKISLNIKSTNIPPVQNQNQNQNQTKLVIDVNDSEPMISQLINIIPCVYRTNNKISYIFEQVDENCKTSSHGIGVTRHVFTILRKELEAIIKNKFVDCSPSMCIKLGKLMYFCNWNGNELFSGVHAYFFYCLSVESDYVPLLKIFKGNCFDLFYNQYKEYFNNRQLLEEVELEEPKDYIKYIIAADLDDRERIAYDNFVFGYVFFFMKNVYYETIKHLPIEYTINKIIEKTSFGALIKFSPGNINDKKNFDYFAKKFSRILNTLNMTEKSIFLENVTGSKYYADTVKIIYAYDADDNENPVSYHIVTCEASMHFYLKPTLENIETVINSLITEDRKMKD